MMSMPLHVCTFPTRLGVSARRPQHALKKHNKKIMLYFCIAVLDLQNYCIDSTRVLNFP